MAFPDPVRVKLSSEEAGSITLTPVVVQQMPLLELLEYVLSATGKDRVRIGEVLRRGTLVSGATRFRWEGWQAADEELESVLARLPDPEPLRPFDAGRCVRVQLVTPRGRLEIRKDGASRTRMFQKANFWEALMRLAVTPAYAGYHYREHTDCYRCAPDAATAEKLKAAAELLRDAEARRRIQTLRVDSIEYFTAR
jgi:hypothetical protein